MTQARSKSRSQRSKAAGEAGTFEDQLLETLKPRAVQLARHAAIWGIRTLAILWIPVKLVLMLISSLIGGLMVGLWREIKETRSEGRVMLDEDCDVSEPRDRAPKFRRSHVGGKE